MALGLAYGPQSNTTNAVTECPADELWMANNIEFQSARATLLNALVLTGYDAERCTRILSDFNRLRKPQAAVA